MKKTILFLVTCVLTLTFLQAQQKVYMPFFEILNIHEDYQYSVSKLFQNYVKNEGKYEILLPKWNYKPYPRETVEETQTVARDLGAPYYIKADLNALGEVIIVTMAMYQTADGEETWSSTLKARRMDDLDPILMVLAKNLGDKEVTTTAQGIYTVTDYEGRELKEVETKICTGPLLGGAYPFGTKFAPGFGWLTTYDNRNLIFGFEGMIFMKESNELGYLAITVDYPFSDSKNTAYLGGGLGYGFISVNNNDYANDYYTNGGLMLEGGGGYILNRTASVRMIIGSRIFLPLFKVNEKVYPGINMYLAINISKRAKRKRHVDVNMN